jgi:hypothetical protein
MDGQVARPIEWERASQTAYNVSGAPRSTPAATADRKLARVNWTRRCELARIKMESLDADHSGIELGIRLQKLSERLGGHVTAARDRNVRMPRSKLRLEAGSERGFLYALVNLEQMRMRLPDADPDNFRSALCGKGSDANNGQKESAELDRAELFSQRQIDVVRHIIKETERQMHLRRVDPACAANVRIEAGKQLTRWLRQIDRNEETLGH